MRLNRFAVYAWGVLAYHLGVIVWGAYVRATGSGAGCGAHWPRCNGQIIPRAPEIETVIEFTHRVSSGLALPLVVALLIWAFRAYPARHRVRTGSVLSLVFLITEGLVGAGLVLFELVADNTSGARAVVVAAHLINTFLLVAVLSLTAWWSTGGPPLRLKSPGRIGWALILGLVGSLLVGASGAVTALGDTLFPAASLAEGIAQDFAPMAHFLIQLRIWHPLIAIATGLYLITLAAVLNAPHYSPVTHTLARVLAALFIVQLSAGALNLLLLAPVWLQMIHLLLADLVWIALILLSASVLVRPEPATAPAARRRAAEPESVEASA